MLHLEAPESAPSASITVPDLRGLTLRQAAVKAWELGLRLGVEGSGLVVAQQPTAGRSVANGTRLTLRASLPGGGRP